MLNLSTLLSHLPPPPLCQGVADFQLCVTVNYNAVILKPFGTNQGDGPALDENVFGQVDC